MQCSARTQLCRDEFTGNTMVQYDLQGNVLFLHANLHKWDMRLPEKFSLHYQRRWHELQPGECGARSPQCVLQSLGASTLPSCRSDTLDVFTWASLCNVRVATP